MAPQFLKSASRVPGRPVGSAVRSAVGTRLSSPPGHEQARKRGAAAPGKSTIGDSAEAPPASCHSRVTALPRTRTEGRSRHKSYQSPVHQLHRATRWGGSNNMKTRLSGFFQQEGGLSTQTGRGFSFLAAFPVFKRTWQP
ncbi:hypothetical protein NDU88_006431 [Pleurodeles waltl]|uniref:Uncharacterized protein n=1 Tax=Pleurodeles waltl TaxID=8319 RepID=A0AAV7SPR5_PLEWA|nr:hypothetical protein NDU88_006431 [Pleurodeles waltl]